LGHTKQHLYRSVLEGISFSIAQHLDIIAGHGLDVKNIMIAGGGTQNHVWMQITADILNRSLQMTEVSLGACYGDALFAAIGDGALSGFSALKNAVRTARVFQPNPQMHECYRPYHRIFDELYPKTREMMYHL
jgi:xylulokinase